jgi:glycosyltransferase involved in cell wall biosynthesis
MFLIRPFCVLRVLLSLHWAAGLNAYAHAGILAVTPKALAAAGVFLKCRVDRIHAHFATHTATCAGIASAVTGIPFSFTAHAYDIYCTATSLRNNTLDWKLRHAIQIFAVSEHGASLLRARLPVAERDRVHRAYVGISMDLFQEQAALAIDHEIRILSIAYLDRKKGLDTLIDACAVLKSRSIAFNLRLFGEGSLRESLVRHIARLGLQKEIMLGEAILQEEVARELAACHVFVMPCRKDEKTGNVDGIPTVFMEAMASGRPVISCPVSGIPEIVRDGETGLLVPSNDPVAVAEAIARLSSDSTLRIRLGKQARTLVERQHDQRANTRQLLDSMTAIGTASENKSSEL